MKPVRTFVVVPSLPKPLERLKELACNLWWSWNPEAIDLFRRLDPIVWESTYHNPVKMLGTISQDRLRKMSEDDGFIAHLQRVTEAFDEYMNTKSTWFAKKHGYSEKPIVAYFSAEYGWAESMPLYSGGLGMLAGDHIKSASDLGIPLVGVGLLYRVGYFQQHLNVGGYQQERFPENDFYNMPIQMQRNENGTPLVVKIQFPGRSVRVQVWKAQVGRISIFLLDTDTPENQAQDRQITGQLYGGDNETRIQQEIILGLAGMQTLHSLNLHPKVYHMNEGHSAFLALERIAIAIERHELSFNEARELTRSSNIFTTHTPVPAGIDVFPRELMEKYFSNYFPRLGISWQDFLDLAWQNDTPKGNGFSMAVLALNLSGNANGVSRLHGRVSREMWKDLFRGYPHNEVPISHITNGVHLRSYISREITQLYDRYLGPRWILEPSDQKTWNRISDIPHEELWRTHERRRERLVAFARARLVQQFQSRGVPPSEVAKAGEVLNPEALTIGFARRFATYKRATLIFEDFERLVKILTNKDRPVQIIFAGKAHPKDEPGKGFIRQIVQFCSDERVRRNIVFLENYDMVVARYLVQGVDVWLNNPRRPLEASGTSGMKASANGVLNLSVLDGWWDEAYNPQVGWAIGQGEEYTDTEYQDKIENTALMELLEKEVVPLFYDRSIDDLPRGWINKMKTNLSQICPVFNTDRMVGEYNDRFYVPSNKRYDDLSADNRKKAKELAAWMEKVKHSWSGMRIEGVESNGTIEHHVGENVDVKVRMFMNGLSPKDILVQAFLGNIGSDDSIMDGETFDLSLGEKGETHCIFEGGLPLSRSGKSGFAIRVIPSHPGLVTSIQTRLITWA